MMTKPMRHYYFGPLSLAMVAAAAAAAFFAAPIAFTTAYSIPRLLQHQQLQRSWSQSSPSAAAAAAAATAATAATAGSIPRTHTRTSALSVGVTFDESPYNMMGRAEACAGSDSCSLDEALACLDDVLRVQTECVGSGVLSASAICADVDVTADIVARLRHKVAVQRRRLAPVKAGVHMVNGVVGIYVVAMVMHGVAAVPDVPVDSFYDTSVVPFSVREWFWAARDGYLPLMIQQLVKNGGLVVDASSFDERAVPFTLQEWSWAVQNGGFANMLQHNMKYGGLLVDASYVNDVTPLTMQEAWWSLTGGYADVALGHLYRNGGL